MMIRSGIRQMLRARRRAIVYLLVMALVCSFLCISLNLRRSASANMQQIYDSFHVMAVPGLTAHITKGGALCQDVSAGNYAGYLPCPAPTYDLSAIENAVGVESVDVRGQYGAYVRQEGLLRTALSKAEELFIDDVLIFTYLGTETAVLPGEQVSSEQGTTVPLRVDWSALGLEPALFCQKIRITNTITPIMVQPSTEWLVSDALRQEFSLGGQDAAGQRDGSVLLQPGQQYITTCRLFPTEARDTAGNTVSYQIDELGINQDYYHKMAFVSYESSAWQAWTTQLAYAPIEVYQDGFWDTDQGAWYQETVKACQIDGNSLTAISTGDLAAVPTFFSGNTYLSAGRDFDAAEQADGAQVCIVSAAMAAWNDWEVGDTISLGFYQSEFVFGGSVSWQTPKYRPLSTGERPDFYEGTFEIIGLFDGKVSTSNHTDESAQYDMRDGLDRRIIFVPKTALQNAPAPAVSQYSTSIRLDPFLAKTFFATMQAEGRLKRQDEGYTLSLSLYDQGIFEIAQSLSQLERVSKLVTGLSAAAVLLAVVTIAILHLIQSRKQIAILRSVGVTRKQTTGCVLAGLLTVGGLGAALGGLAGQALSSVVARRVVQTAYLDAADDTFTAILAKGSGAADYALRLGARWPVSLLTVLCVLALLTVLAALPVWRESGKSPLQQLGVKE